MSFSTIHATKENILKLYEYHVYLDDREIFLLGEQLMLCGIHYLMTSFAQLIMFIILVYKEA